MAFANELSGRNLGRICLACLTALYLLSLCACVSPKVKLGQEAAATLNFAGDYAVMFFSVTNEAGTLWELYPNKGNLTLQELSTVKYGEVPALCHQAEPKPPLPPAPLVEGGTYTAFAVIFDASPVQVRFTIKQGRAVELPKK